MSYLDALKSLDGPSAPPAKPAKVGYAGFAGTVPRGIAKTMTTDAPSDGGDNRDSVTTACSWLCKFPMGDLLVVYVPAVSRRHVQRDHPTLISAAIAQSCSQCLWNFRPGQAPGGYCSSPDRNDEPGPFSHGHPARFLAKDGGAACEYFEGLHNGYSVNNTKL